MTAHLLLVMLGPVQDFIMQARRTRDLWYGSHLLSEISRAAARALVDGGADLVFPALKKGDPELTACAAPLRADGNAPHNIANKLLAEVPQEIDPARLARAVREEVCRYWREEEGLRVKRRCDGILARDIDAVWNEQIDSLLEFTASWAPLDDYVEARRRVEDAVAGRKMLRDFRPSTQSRGAVAKSALDGARETVLLPHPERRASLVKTYRIDKAEELDAVGLVKRAGGEPDQFVPIVNVALASWLESAEQVAPAELARLRAACGKAGVAPVHRSDLPCARRFPFDASVLIPSRWPSVFEERQIPGDPASWGRDFVRPILDKAGEAYPYVACLVADGDRMGCAISRLETAAAHRDFSLALARFAGEAREVVEQDHRGVLVYSGGDDVVAFLPVPEALACAEALRLCFASVMGDACSASTAEERPTLSVGVGVGHFMESMGELLDLGRAAEHEAKRDRNALAVLVEKRSGGRRVYRAPWSGRHDHRLRGLPADGPVDQLRKDAVLLRKRLSTRKVYEIASTVARLPAPGGADDAAWAKLLALEVKRSLARVEGEAVSLEDAGLSLDTIDYAALHDRVRAWVARLLVARTFADAEPHARRSEDEVAA